VDPASVFAFGFCGLLLGGFAAAARTSDRRRAKRHELIRSTLQNPERRAAAIKQLKREIESVWGSFSYEGIPRRGRRRSPVIRQTRMMLAEVLLADDRPGEALQQLGFIALPDADKPWVEELRLLACEAELAMRNPDAAANWLKPGDGDTPRLADMHAQISLLRGQCDEAMKRIDQARPLTRARVLAAAGRERDASEILRQLSHAELETIQRRHANEPVAALAQLLISSPYR
jgi:hypothetical protein